MRQYSHFVRPGYIELFTGTMKSGKTRELLHRLDQLSYLENCEYLLVKPRTDTRSKGVFTRDGHEIPCALVKAASEIPALVTDAHSVVAIDEAQFFGDDLVDVTLSLARAGMHVLIAGLDLNFRGEPFGPIPNILCHANEVHKLSAVCAVPGCENIARLPQRLRKGKPTPYDAPTIVVEGEGDDTYEPRCMHHFVIPGSPRKKYPVKDRSLLDEGSEGD